jgi:hypothetical protein
VRIVGKLYSDAGILPAEQLTELPDFVARSKLIRLSADQAALRHKTVDRLL